MIFILLKILLDQLCDQHKAAAVQSTVLIGACLVFCQQLMHHHFIAAVFFEFIMSMPQRF
jgi:hypothetical protein